MLRLASSERSKAAVAWLVLIWLAAAPSGCGRPAPTPPPPPAKVAVPIKEADLNTLTLTEQAERRLGIATSPIARRSVPRRRSVGGEVVVPPGQSLTVSAPVAGTVLGTVPAGGSLVERGQIVLRLYPLPASADLTSAGVRLEAARKRAARADELLRAEAGSQRSLDEARSDLALAEAQSAAVRPRLGQGAGRAALTVGSPRTGVLRDVFVGAGQSVAAGAPLFRVDALAVLWVRVPIYVGDLADIDVAAEARVQPLGTNTGAGWLAVAPVAAPPSANPEAASTDLIFKLEGGDFRPGQRVRVALPLRGSEEGLVLPWSAVVLDIQGGTWVYERAAAGRIYTRRRVEVKHVLAAEGETLAVLARGPAEGTRVVTAGAAELYGTEFGSGK